MARDDSVYAGRSFVAGSTRRDYHSLGVDPARDLDPTFRGDLAFAPDGAACWVCGSVLTAERGAVLATRQVFPPPSYSDDSGAVRLGGAVALTINPLAWFEEILLSAADDAGIAWPAMASPSDVHVIDLKAAAGSRRAAESLEDVGLRVLLDDRSIGAGAKLTDADHIGCPLRVTVSLRSLEAGGAELSPRRGTGPEIIPPATLAGAVQAHLAGLMSS